LKTENHQQGKDKGFHLPSTSGTIPGIIIVISGQPDAQEGFYKRGHKKKAVDAGEVRTSVSEFMDKTGYRQDQYSCLFNSMEDTLISQFQDKTLFCRINSAEQKPISIQTNMVFI
jgi:hypothetical protein